jgi:hypothetical protein
MRTQQQNKNPFGVMVIERSRLEARPMYHSILLKHGFVDRHADTSTTWGIWMRVCESPAVVRKAQEIERPKWRIASVTAGYQRTDQVLTAMTPRQKAALKKRLGVV